MIAANRHFAPYGLSFSTEPFCPLWFLTELIAKTVDYEAVCGSSVILHSFFAFS